MNKCNQRFKQDFEVTNIIEKIRDTYGMLRYLKDKESRVLLRFIKERIVDLSDEGEILRGKNNKYVFSSDSSSGNSLQNLT